MAKATDRDRKAHDSTTHFSPAQKQSVRRRLLAWYAKHARDLPWRKSQDPYRVWVSEIMLQQTQVATVRDYFKRFTVAFPTVHKLAAADEVDVLRLWEGLGYYRRARQLHAAAIKVVAEHAGEFPHDLCELQSLPGIGRYTAGAIASIAFGKRAPILEANTIRLFSRLIAYRGEAASAVGQRVLWQFAEEILPQKDVAPFNQALMELGSLVCTPTDPKCHECPLAGVCAANAVGLQREIPLAKPRQIFTELREAAVVIRKNGSVLLRRCGEKERWAGLWDFPRFELEASGPLFAKREIATKVEIQTGISCEPGALFKTLKHGVTRYRITLDCYDAAYVEGRVRSNAPAEVRWQSRSNLQELPLSTTGRKIANLIANGRT
ncbi:MAG TPA: A/G-specific adenine glycosylase [Lacipirellulaceae bacterium]|jgi:A/G-specific adenine glycosylase|nr:A/G-specific adenine glycosylase [Lacipirellulaceae bacterium]